MSLFPLARSFKLHPRESQFLNYSWHVSGFCFLAISTSKHKSTLPVQISSKGFHLKIFDGKSQRFKLKKALHDSRKKCHFIVSQIKFIDWLVQLFTSDVLFDSFSSCKSLKEWKNPNSQRWHPLVFEFL